MVCGYRGLRQPTFLAAHEAVYLPLTPLANLRLGLASHLYECLMDSGVTLGSERMFEYM